MKFVKSTATTAKSKHAPEDFTAVKRAFMDDVVVVVTMENVTMELVLNWV